MSHAVKTFQFQGVFGLRTLDIENQPWWIAKDVANILGYRLASDVTRFLDDDEKGMYSVHTLGGRQTLTAINEPGLYATIMRSKSESAKDFKRWVTHTVLPTIRQTGSFSVMPEVVTPRAINDYSLADTWDRLGRAAFRAAEELRLKDMQIIELEQHAEIRDNYTSALNEKDVGMVAKELHRAGLFSGGKNLLFEEMQALGWLFRPNDRSHGQWSAYQTVVTRGLLTMKNVKYNVGTRSVHYSKVMITGKGVTELTKLLREKKLKMSLEEMK